MSEEEYDKIFNGIVGELLQQTDVKNKIKTLKEGINKLILIEKNQLNENKIDLKKSSMLINELNFIKNISSMN